MLVIHGNGIASQLPVKCPGAALGLELFQECFSVSKGHINSTGILVNKVKFFRYGAEGETAARNASFEGIHHTLLVNGSSGQVPETAKIPVHGLWRAGVPVSGQSLPGRSHRCAEQERRQLCPFKDGHNAFICRAVALPVAAARRLQDGIQPCQLPVHCREVHIHARFDQ